MLIPSAVSAVPATTATERSAFFHCFLADQPEYLVPERLLEESALQPATAIVNPNVWFTWRDELPVTIRDLYPLPEMFLPDCGLVWVEDPVTRMKNPFWAGPWFQSKLEGVYRGGQAAGLTSHHRDVLRQAGILISPSDMSHSVRWEHALEEASQRFETDGYAHLHGLVHPFHLGALRRYYRRLIRVGGMKLGDEGSARRYVAYEESVARFFHHQIAAIVGTVVGTHVIPSFAYVGSYLGGADLVPHTDREECDYALSFLVDFTPEPHDQSPWPLYLETGSGVAAAWQALGDAVLYRGRQMLHYRKPLANHATSTSIFFYYVPAW